MPRCALRLALAVSCALALCAGAAVAFEPRFIRQLPVASSQATLVAAQKDVHADGRKPQKEEILKELEEEVETDVAGRDKAHGHGDAGHKAGLPQMDPRWFPSQIFWLCLTFAVLYVVLDRRIIPDMDGLLQNRRAKITGDLESAEALRARAETLKTEYEALLADTANRSADLFAKVESEICASSAAHIDALRAAGTAKIQEMEKELSRARKQALDQVHEVAAEVAAKAAAKIVGINAGADAAMNVIRNINRKAA